MFRTVRLSIIRSLFTVHSAMVYVIQVRRQLSSRTRMEPSWSCSKNVWHIPLLSAQWTNSWWWTDELSETCKSFMPKYIFEVSASNWFYYKEICYDARSHELKIFIIVSFICITSVVDKWIRIENNGEMLLAWILRQALGGFPYPIVNYVVHIPHWSSWNWSRLDQSIAIRSM
jgi:hypothetical protein